MPRLVKQIEKKVKAGLQKPWVPTAALFHGARDCGDFYSQQSFGGSCPLRTENIKVPNTQENISDCKFYSNSVACFYCLLILL